jgi:hypothetical protein
MHWISIKQRKPKEMSMCFVINIKRPGRVVYAIYNASYDEWMVADYAKSLEFPLEVSHYIEMPPFPQEPFKKTKKSCRK